jgi:hypothetical protein
VGVLALVGELAVAAGVDAEELALGAGGDQQGAVGATGQRPDVGLPGIEEDRPLAVGRDAIDLAVRRGAREDGAVAIDPQREDLGLGGGVQLLDLAAAIDGEDLAGVAGADHPAVGSGAGGEEKRLAERGQTRGARRQAQPAERIDADPSQPAGEKAALVLGFEDLDLGGVECRGRHESGPGEQADEPGPAPYHRPSPSPSPDGGVFGGGGGAGGAAASLLTGGGVAKAGRPALTASRRRTSRSTRTIPSIGCRSCS